MNITIPKNDLVRAIARCADVADKRSSMPILSCVLISARPGIVSVAATDMHTAARAEVECQGADKGGCAADARDVQERLKHMPDGPVKLAHSAGKLVITAPGSARKFTLNAHDAGDFPQLVLDAGDGPACVISPDALGHAIDSVSYAVSLDETRAHVNSALFVWCQNTLAIVATDGHRLSRVEVVATCGERVEALVPLRALGELRRLCGDAEVTMRRVGARLFATAGETTFTTLLIDAAFPPYEQVIPERSRKNVRCGRAALISALEAVDVTAKAAKGPGMLRLELDVGKLIISAESAAAGEALDEVPAECSERLIVGVNGRYLVQPLSVLDSDEVDLSFGGELDPIRIDGGGLVAVVMPSRLGDAR